MTKKATREDIIQAADDLFYRQGFENTSFAHIAAAVGISRGNFYYHFKTKDEILLAVINRRLAKTAGMLEQWAVEGATPLERIRCFVHILIRNQSQIQQYGCPVGTLTSELAKLDHPARAEANKIFTLFRTWLAAQFRAMGCGAAADGYAMHVLGRSQGVATLANAFHDEDFIRSEVAQLDAWLETCS